MELIQEVSEDKKLTVFMEKRFKEYERDLSSSESLQRYKDEIEVCTYKLLCYHTVSLHISIYVSIT